MKLKHIALAAALVASAAAANAAVTGDVYLNMWDATGSYSKDTGISMAAIDANLASGSFNFTLDLSNGGADPLFSSFVAAHSTYSWDLVGYDNTGTYTTISTFTGTKATVAPTKTVMGTLTSNFANLYANMGTALSNPDSATVMTNGVDAVYTNSSSANTYAGTSFVNGSTMKMGIFGSNANNSFASGLGFIKEAALQSGTASAIQTPYTAGEKAYFSGTTLNIAGVAAVPEADSLAMLLAGMGLVGSIARRRNRKTA